MSTRWVVFVVGALFVSGCSQPRGVRTELARVREHVTISGRPFLRADHQANTFTTSAQDEVALATHADGTTVVVWQSRRQEHGQYGIFAQQFDPSGKRIGSETHINAVMPNSQQRPVAAIGSAGVLWIAWESYGQDGDRGAIIARAFDRALNPLGSEMVVNTVTRGHQAEPAIAALPDGRAVVTWASPVTRQVRSIAARVITTQGDGLPAITLSDNGRNRTPSLDCDANGRVLVAWTHTHADSLRDSIVARRIDVPSSTLGPKFDVSPQDDNNHIEPSVSVNSSGRAVVAWATQIAEDYAIRFVRLEAVERSGPQQVVDRGAFEQTIGTGSALADDGRIAVVWSSIQPGDNQRRLAGRVFDWHGAAQSSAFRMTAARTGKQQITVSGGARRVAFHPHGGLACAWTGDAAAGDGSAAALTLLLQNNVESTCSPTRATPLQSARPHAPPSFKPSKKVTRAEILSAESGTAPPGFPGIPFTGWNPPDPSIAVGPNHIVQMTNGQICIFDKTGNELFCDAIEAAGGFWGSLGATQLVFDPEVIWDAGAQRYIAMANERGFQNAPYVLLAISDDDDPTGSWYKYRINVQAEANGTGIDSPNIAVDDDVIYVTADFLGFNSRYFIFMIEKAPLLSGGAVTSTSLTMPGDLSIGLPQSFGNRPAQYLVQAIVAPSASAIDLHAILDPLGTPSLTSFSLTVPLYQAPSDVPTQGTTNQLETFDGRFWSCMYRDGSLWATHHVGSVVKQRWYEIAMNGWPTSGQDPALVQSGEVDPGPGIRTFFGSIWADPDDSVALVYSQSSANEFVSMRYSGRAAGDPLGEMSGNVLVQSSTEPVIGSDRWGDYSDVTHDSFNPGTFWGASEYRPIVDGWATWITDFFIVEPEPWNVLVDLQLSPTMAAGSEADPIDRCILFEVSSCDTPGQDLSLTQVVTFGQPDDDPGFGAAAFEIPAGTWDCLTVSDPKHTLRVRCPLTCDDLTNTCAATFGGSPEDEPECHWLIGGNLDENNEIDIFDYTILTAHYLTQIDKDTACDLQGAHADINGDGLVSLADFGFILFHFLKLSDEDCAANCGPGPTPPGGGPRTSVTVAELRARGLGKYVATADRNRDGVVDSSDIADFLKHGGADAKAAGSIFEAVRKATEDKPSNGPRPRH